MASMAEVASLWGSFPRIARVPVDRALSRRFPGLDAASLDDATAWASLEPALQIQLFDSVIPQLLKGHPHAAFSYRVFRRLSELNAWAAAQRQQGALRAYLVEVMRAADEALPAARSQRLLALAQALRPCEAQDCARGASCASGGLELLLLAGMRSGSGSGSAAAAAGACGGKLGSAAAATALRVLGEEGSGVVRLELLSEVAGGFALDEVQSLLRQATLAAVAQCDEGARPQLRAALLAQLHSLRGLLEALLALMRSTPGGQPLLLPAAQLPPAAALQPFAELLETLGLAPCAGAEASAAAAPPGQADARTPLTLAAPMPLVLEALRMAGYCSERLAAAGEEEAAGAPQAEGAWGYLSSAAWEALKKEAGAAAAARVPPGSKATPLFETSYTVGAVQLPSTVDQRCQ